MSLVGLLLVMVGGVASYILLRVVPRTRRLTVGNTV